MKTKTVLGLAALLGLMAASKKKTNKPKQSIAVWADVETTTAQAPDKMPPLLAKPK